MNLLHKGKGTQENKYIKNTFKIGNAIGKMR